MISTKTLRIKVNFFLKEKMQRIVSLAMDYHRITLQFYEFLDPSTEVDGVVKQSGCGSDTKILAHSTNRWFR